MKTYSVQGTAPDIGDILGIKDTDMAPFHGNDRLVGRYELRNHTTVRSKEAPGIIVTVKRYMLF